MSAAERRAGYIAGLRQLAELLEQNPDIPLPYTGSGSAGRLDWILVSRAPEWQRTILLRLAGLVGDVAEDSYDQDTRVIGRLAGLHVGVLVDQQAVCERVVVGTEQREVVEYRLALPTSGAGER